MKTISDYQKEFKELTFDNNGYAEISREVKEKYLKEITCIENILRKVIPGFVRFQNFKPRKDGKIDVRCQYYWDERFIGVGYFPLAEIEEEVERQLKTK